MAASVRAAAARDGCKCSPYGRGRRKRTLAIADRNCGRKCPRSTQDKRRRPLSLARNPHATPALLHLYEPAASSTAPADVVSRRAADACREERHREGHSYYTLSSQNPSAMSAVRHSAESPSKSIDLKPAVFPAATFVLESSTKHTTSLVKSTFKSFTT